MKFSMPKKAGLLLAAVLAGLVVVLFVKPGRNERRAPSDQLRTAVAKIGDVTDVIRLRGTVTSSKKVPIFSETSGQIMKLYVKENDQVEKGALLLQFDETQIQNDVAKQQMSVEKARISLDSARRDFERKKAMHDEKFISDAVFADAEKARDIAKIDYELAHKDLDALTTQLGKTHVRAPLSGIVTKKSVEEGEVVTRTADNPYGKMLLEIADIANKEIEVNVSESERKAVVPGTEVTCWLDADPKKKIKGVIEEIGASAVTVNNVNLFNVRVGLPGDVPELTLGVGMNVEIVAQEARQVITVPVEALFRDGPAWYVHVVGAKGLTQKRVVRRGLSDTRVTEITRGLSAGERVLLEEPDLDSAR